MHKVADPFYSSSEWIRLRLKALSRDRYTCVSCGFKGESRDLQVDHILPRKTHPQLRLVIDNLRTLCRPCHSNAGTSMGRKGGSVISKIKPKIGLDGFPVRSEWSK